MDSSVQARCAIISCEQERLATWRVGHSQPHIPSRLHVDYYGLRFKFTQQVVLVAVGRIVAIVTTCACAVSASTSAPA
jgi:hypothetical protein